MSVTVAARPAGHSTALHLLQLRLHCHSPIRNTKRRRRRINLHLRLRRLPFPPLARRPERFFPRLPRQPYSTIKGLSRHDRTSPHSNQDHIPRHEWRDSIFYLSSQLIRVSLTSTNNKLCINVVAPSTYHRKETTQLFYNGIPFRSTQYLLALPHLKQRSAVPNRRRPHRSGKRYHTRLVTIIRRAHSLS